MTRPNQFSQNIFLATPLCSHATTAIRHQAQTAASAKKSRHIATNGTDWVLSSRFGDGHRVERLADASSAKARASGVLPLLSLTARASSSALRAAEPDR